MDRITFKNVRSDSTKKISGDTRNNWIEMLFITKKRFRCFRKQTHIDTCKQRLKELESLGFEFGEFGFADNHVHFQVNIPKRYSVEETEIILKSETATYFRKRCLEKNVSAFHLRAFASLSPKVFSA